MVIREPNHGWIDSTMYHDELNRAWEGKHYGFPEGFSGEPDQTHIGPLWKLDKINRAGGERALDWWVPTGIDTAKKFGKIRNPVFMGSWGTRAFDATDVGAIEMFWGADMQNRMTLLDKMDGTTEVRYRKGAVYAVEWNTSRIYRITPKKGGNW